MKKKRMVNIGRKRLVELIEEMGLSREVVADKIGLSKGGLYHVTHKSGKMAAAPWASFKKEYTKITGNEVEIDERSGEKEGLGGFSLEDLLAEIVDRGWEVTFRKSQKQ